jgi:hypothetical protein
VGPDVTSGLDGIEKPLDRLFVLVEVEVHSQTRVLSRLTGHTVEQRLVDATSLTRHKRAPYDVASGRRGVADLATRRQRHESACAVDDLW